jgi:splicing factor 4
MNKGKHHIGDFLPPKELEKFIEKAKAIKEGRNPGEWGVGRNETDILFSRTDFSDYKEHKLEESNVGFQLLQKAGWTEGQGLGEKGDGIVDPINQ